MQQQRTCPYCGEQLVRRSDEKTRQAFKRRQYCGLACYYGAKQRAWVDIDGPPWTEQDCGYATPCWVWDRATNSKGYGWISAGGKKVPAYRWVYEHVVGPIPDGLEPDHLCRNRACVNPAHLEPVTHAENLRRGTSPTDEHSRRTHCPAGHPYSGDNLHIDRRGFRVCRACHARFSRESKARRRALRDQGAG